MVGVVLPRRQGVADPGSLNVRRPLASMRSSRRALAGLVAAAALAVAPASAVGAQAVEFGPLAGNVRPALDPTTGTVEIAAIGSATDSVVPVIVRNATDSPVKAVRVTITKAGPSGTPVARTGASFAPSVLAPGALAVGGVDFGTADDALRQTTGSLVSSKPAAAHARGPDLRVRNVQQVAPTSVDGLPAFKMQLANRTGRAVKGPLTVTIMCFGESGRPTGVFSSDVDRGRVRKNQTIRASVELATLCPAYLVGARGRCAA